RARRPSKIVGDELVRPLVLIYDTGLPGQEIGGHPLLIALPFQLPSRIDDALLWRNLAPVVEPLAPVVQSPDLIQLVHRLELVLKIFDEPGLNVGISRSARRSFIVNLPTDDRRVVFVVLKK